MTINVRIPGGNGNNERLRKEREDKKKLAAAYEATREKLEYEEMKKAKEKARRAARKCCCCFVIFATILGLFIFLIFAKVIPIPECITGPIKNKTGFDWDAWLDFYFGSSQCVSNCHLQAISKAMN